MTTKTIQMYRTNLDGSETTLYPLTEAKYVTMDDGTTIEEALTNSDSSKYSPVIESSKAMFKVGEGDSVDLSESAIDGAYNSCVLKGKTMVNCIQEPSSQDVVLPYEFEEGQYVTINDTKESGALGVELKGQTLVNLCQNLGNETSTSTGVFISGEISVKTNTTYMVVAKVKSSNPLSSISLSSFLRVDSIITGNILGGVTGDITTAYTTKSFTFNTGNTTTVKINLRNAYNDWGLTKNTAYTKEVMLIEYQEGMENWDIPYFEGMASCKMPILHTVGKNLIVGGDTIKEFTKDTDFSINYPSFKLHDNIDLNSLVGKTLTLSCRVKKTAGKTNNPNQGSLGGRFGIHGTLVWENASGQTETRYPYAELLSEHDDNIDGVISKTYTFTPPSGYDRISSFKFSIQLYARPSGNDTWSFGQVQMELGSTATSYESYKTSILSLPEEVVLRGIPNGVHDTLNLRTGEYTQRVGVLNLNGSEYWSIGYGGATGDVNKFEIAIPCENMLGYAYPSICDKFVWYPASGTTPEWGYRVSYSNTNKNAYFMFAPPTSVVALHDREAWKTWLSQNPTTVYYQLETPVVTKINLPSTLKSWNTTTHIYSEIPENTLYPILSHSNPSYPVILKPSTKYSIVANSYSNDHTNSDINFNLGGATASTTVGSRVTTITTPSTLSNELLTMSGRGNKLNNVMVIEGDVAGDEPYFEGICDCKTPILSNCGKNLAKLTRSYTSFGLTFKVIDDTLYVDGTAERILDYYLTINNCENSKMLNSLEVGTMVTLSNSLGLRNYFGVWRNGTTDDSWFANTMTIQNGDNNIRCFIRFDQGSTYNNQAIKIQLEATQNPTTYEPYKSNTTTFEQKDDKTIVLRSLPNGVCDTLNVETGEYIKRIGEKTFSGANNEGWTIANNGIKANTIAFGYSGLNGATRNTNVLCDTFIYPANYPEDREGIQTQSSNQGQIYISIFTSKLSTPDAAGFKAWLQTNPVTVQYELATPIVSTIDIQGFPYAYTNGHVQLSSGHSEQSLTPKVEYSLVANRNGQIEANTKSIRRHQDKLDDFEALMLTQMIQTHYEKTLLQFDFEMQMMALGGE